MSVPQKRIVFYDEFEGKVRCHSQKCDWEDDWEYIHEHYTENHSEEMLSSNDNQLKWKYAKTTGHENKTLFACIADTMIWIHQMIEDEDCHVACQYVECGDLSYNVRVESPDENLGVGSLDKHPVLSKSIPHAEVLKHKHFTIKNSVLKKICAENETPDFVLTLFENSKIEETILEISRMYLRDEKLECETVTGVPYHCVTFGINDYICAVCEDSTLHMSQLRMCDEGHSVCLGCKENTQTCPVQTCDSEFSNLNKNPAVEDALRLLGLEGMPYE